MLPRILASVAAIALVASVPAWSLTHPGNTDVEPGDSAAAPWGGSDSPTPSAGDVDAGEEHPDADNPAPNAAPDDGAPPSAGTFNGTSGIVDFNGVDFWIGPPGSLSEVAATVAAYRAARGLPAFAPYPLDGWSCSIAAYGSAVMSGNPTSQTLGQLLVSTSPAAVGFRPTAGWKATAHIVVDELILGDGTVYPNRSTQIGVSHCSPPPPPPTTPPTTPPTEPTPPPADPPPADPPPTDPPVEPEPTDPPAP
jgi:hypothetical protein